MGTPNVDRPWPLVGRDSTLDDLSSTLDGGELVVLRGPAGAGKSRVLHELAQRREACGDTVIRMSGVDATARLPLAPLLPLLPTTPAEITRHPTHDVVRHALAEVYRLAASAPVLLLVDDAHRLSDEVASFVHQVCQQELATSVIAAREMARLPDPLDALWHGGRAVRREIGPLGFDQVASLLEAVLGDVVEPGTAVRLWEASRGHPLYLRELVIGAVERGVLAFGEHGVWIADDDLAGGHRITELIRSRLDDLTTDEVDLLIACAAQPNIPRRVMELVVQTRTITALFARGLIEEVRDGRRRELTPAHPLYAEVATAVTDPEHRRVVLGRLADAWEMLPGRRSADPAIIAELRLGAGGDVKPELLLEAARAPGVDPVRADELATLAESADGGSHRAEATLERATALGRRGDWSRAKTLFETAWEMIGDHGRAEVARRWIAASWDNEPDLGATIDLIERSSDTVGDDPALADTLLLARAFSEPLDRMFPVALDRLDSPDLPDEQRASAQLITAAIQAHRGRLVDSIERARAAADTGLLSPLGHTRAGSLVCDDLAWSGQIHDSLAEANILLHAARVDGDVDREITMRHVLQNTLLLSGRAADSVVEGRRTLRLVTIAREVHVGPTALADLVLALSMLDGAEDEARSLLREVDALPPSARYMPASIADLAAAHIAATDEDRRTRLADAAAVARERGCLIHLARALYEHHRLGVAASRELVDELVGVADEMEGVARLWLREIVATESGDVDGLSALSLDAERRGLDLLALETAARAAHAAVGAADHGAAFVLGRRSRRLASNVRGTRSAVTAPPGVLTASEHRVVEGAIVGSSDRQLADQLDLSIRTVHGHLHRSYRKLGLTGRDELRDLMARHDPVHRAATVGAINTDAEEGSRHDRVARVVRSD